jgi:hypothetical protein
LAQRRRRKAEKRTIRGVLDPAKPGALEGKKDVMVDGVPPLTHSVTWDLTRN